MTVFRMRAACVAFVLAFAGRAAAELTAKEREHVRALAAMLDDGSPRVRDGAEAALRAIGADAIPVLAEAPCAAGTPRRRALEELCRTADPVAARSRLREAAVATGDSGWREELVAMSKAAESADDVAAKVSAIFEKVRGRRSWSSSDPELGELVALGRPAFPLILDQARTGDRHEAAFLIERSLDRLSLPEDIPALRGVLLTGDADVVDHALARLANSGSFAAEQALVEAVRQGIMSFDIGRALRQARDRVAAGAAVLDWARKNPRAESWHAWPAAEALAALRPDGAVEAVAALAAAQTDAQGLCGVGSELLRLGDLRGADALLKLLRGESTDRSSDGWRLADCVKTLDRLTGLAHPDLHRSRGREDVDPAPYRKAADDFAAWLAENRAKLRFDAASGRWSQGAASPVDAAIAKQVERARKAVQAAGHLDSIGSDSPAVGYVTALGHDVVPTLVHLLETEPHHFPASAIFEFALDRLAEPGDVPMLRAALLRGCDDVTEALGGLAQRRAAGALDALIAAVEQGSAAGPVFRAISRSDSERRSVPAILAWMRKQPKGRIPPGFGTAAQFVAAEAHPRVLETLRPFAEAARGHHDGTEVGRALLACGDFGGFDLLLRAVADCATKLELNPEEKTTPWGGRDAVEALDAIAGLSRPMMPDVGMEDSDTGPALRWFQQAKSELDAWWAASKDRLVYHAGPRKWIDGDVAGRPERPPKEDPRLPPPVPPPGRGR
ncbi:MAG: hypothetical protein HMLKMBBP_03737 [Planctomycetes bacterium]|nr:hypothetical protein [Planctomycetota bacterium]